MIPNPDLQIAVILNLIFQIYLWLLAKPHKLLGKDGSY
ncbi:hypothetical protein N826_27330 [Skermanella aerolata KACC 11604]|nr:hypothetical protein N826_27330 [Skermanella aerolata KACC 11604]